MNRLKYIVCSGPSISSWWHTRGYSAGLLLSYMPWFLYLWSSLDCSCIVDDYDTITSVNGPGLGVYVLLWTLKRSYMYICAWQIYVYIMIGQIMEFEMYSYPVWAEVMASMVFMEQGQKQEVLQSINVLNIGCSFGGGPWLNGRDGICNIFTEWSKYLPNVVFTCSRMALLAFGWCCYEVSGYTYFCLL